MMKILIFLFTFSSLVANGRIDFELKGLRSNDGSIVCGLFKGRDGYPTDSDKGYKGMVVKIQARSARCSFTNLPSGEYAAAFIHDSDGNGTMTTNSLGIPTEGYGFSNNAAGRFGPPGFSAARIFLGKGEATQQQINIKYLF